jgi:ubiquinone/menaquinone biosynthesis C-methylase UbiE
MVRDEVAALAAGPAGFACCPGKDPERGTASLAGYAPDVLDAFSRKIPVFSHGCGTPVAFAGIRRGETVFDLGSGAGLDLLLAGERAGPEGRIVGLDITPEIVARAGEVASAWGAGNVEVRAGMMEELPFETGTADRVISNCAVCLSPEKARVFTEIGRVLRPGGRVTISDIVVDGLPRWARKNRNLYTSCIAGALGEEEYLEELEKAGFGEVRVLEKHFFDESRLETFLLVGMTGSGRKDPCSCGDYLAGRLLGRTAEKLTGKVGSITLEARVPSRV